MNGDAGCDGARVPFKRTIWCGEDESARGAARFRDGRLISGLSHSAYSTASGQRPRVGQGGEGGQAESFQVLRTKYDAPRTRYQVLWTMGSDVPCKPSSADRCSAKSAPSRVSQFGQERSSIDQLITVVDQGTALGADGRLIGWGHVKITTLPARRCLSSQPCLNDATRRRLVQWLS
jgi:hypothetical protein